MVAYHGRWRVSVTAKDSDLFLQPGHEVVGLTVPRVERVLGTHDLGAARVIGGLPVTHNFVPDGRTTHILYGPTCNMTLRPDGEFEVVEDVPPVIG